MREMVLNHASLLAPNQHTAVERLKDVTAGMLELVRDGIVRKTLRMSHPLHETHCMPDWSLWDALLELRRGQGEFAFFASLASKLPLLSDIDQDIKGRFLGCEAKALPPEDGAPLVLCAITDGIAVGFPSDGWDRDQLTIRFNEMLPDGNIVEASEAIDNLTRSAHARSICERHRAALRQCKNGVELWKAREAAFPNLVFGPDVEHHIAKLGGTDLRMLVEKLTMLDALTATWRANRGPAPPGWDEAGVRNESETVRRMNPELREARRFRSRCGPPELFFWHIDFRGDKRIHFRFDDSHVPHKRKVEIGYIGKKLPTKLFPN